MIGPYMVSMVLAACVFEPSLINAAECSAVPLVAKSDYRATKSNPVTYQVDFRAIVTPPYKTKLLRVWLPIPPTDNAQEVSGSGFFTFPLPSKPSIDSEPVFGNTFAYFEFNEPQGAQIIQHKFTVKTWQLDWNLDPVKVPAVDRWPSDFAPYLRNETQAVVIDERVKNISAQVVPARKNAAGDIASILSWVNANMKYSHNIASLAASSQHALNGMTGHCSDYHGLCASLGRSLGYPTRVTYGMNPFPKNSPSHCKLEAFIPARGWVSFDVSETQKMIADIAKDSGLSDIQKKALIDAANARLGRGFRDNTWFLQTRGTDYDLVPKASQRVPVVRTIYAEADGKPLKDPDPSNTDLTGFAWMTSHEYVADREVSYPFRDRTTLALSSE